MDLDVFVYQNPLIYEFGHWMEILNIIFTCDVL